MEVYVKTLGQSGLERTKIEDANLLGILLKMDDGQEFSIRKGARGLRISATYGKLVVEPEASNVIQVSESRE